MVAPLLEGLYSKPARESLGAYVLWGALGTKAFSWVPLPQPRLFSGAVYGGYSYVAALLLEPVFDEFFPLGGTDLPQSFSEKAFIKTVRKVLQIVCTTLFFPAPFSGVGIVASFQFLLSSSAAYLTACAVATAALGVIEAGKILFEGGLRFMECEEYLERAPVESLMQSCSPKPSETCSICLSPLDSEVVRIQCNHRYHKDCLQEWLKRTLSRQRCPCCRERCEPLSEKKTFLSRLERMTSSALV